MIRLRFFWGKCKTAKKLACRTLVRNICSPRCLAPLDSGHTLLPRAPARAHTPARNNTPRQICQAYFCPLFWGTEFCSRNLTRGPQCATVLATGKGKPVNRKGKTMQTEEICTESAPESITFYLTAFTMEKRARCKNCNFVSAYWECACELVHDCEVN